MRDFFWLLEIQNGIEFSPNPHLRVTVNHVEKSIRDLRAESRSELKAQSHSKTEISLADKFEHDPTVPLLHIQGNKLFSYFFQDATKIQRAFALDQNKRMNRTAKTHLI